MTGREISSPDEDRLSPSSEDGNGFFILVVAVLPLRLTRRDRISSSNKKTSSANFKDCGVGGVKGGEEDDEASAKDDNCGVPIGLGEKSQLSIVASLIGFWG